MTNIRSRDRDALLQALRAGVVPRTGQQLIQVGRSKEVEALVVDIERVASGGALFRLIIGEFGSGKTFFLNLVRAIALEKKLVVANADLNPDRRLHASGGQARSLYVELMRNIATRSKSDGGALSSIVEKLVSGMAVGTKEQPHRADQAIRKTLEPLSDLVGGYDFIEVIAAYWRGFDTGDDTLKNNAIRWLRGEFTTKTEAREALGVRTIVDDAAVYDQLKLMAKFVRLAGYAGLLICLDELVNLYKLANTQARNANYEQILRILNDVLQNPPEGFGVLMGGTPDFLYDTRRGLFSYPALQSRLAENSFARDGLVDYTAPVMKLGSLSQEEFYVLLQKLREVHASGDPARIRIPDEGLTAFMMHCQKKVGEVYFRTPRTTITSFADLLAVLDQNPTAQWRTLIGQVNVERDQPPSSAVVEDVAANRDITNIVTPALTHQVPSPKGDDDEFATFKI